MLKFLVILFLFVIMIHIAPAQNISSGLENTLTQVDKLQLAGKTSEAVDKIENALKLQGYSPDELACLYARYSRLLVFSDSLLAGKKALDIAMENAKTNEAKATAYRAKVSLNNALNQPDDVVKDAKYGLTLLGENSKDLNLLFAFNYLLYSAYSNWKNVEKMEEYIRECEKYAVLANKEDLLVNAYNGISSTFLAKFEKTKEKIYADSSFSYLQESYALCRKNLEKIGTSTYTITCINIANHFLEYSGKTLAENKSEAFSYLALAEKELSKSYPHSEMWVNIFGIKSDFALRENNLQLAENYLLQGLMKLQTDVVKNSGAAYTVYTKLAELAARKNNFLSAYNYQRKAEMILKKIFDQRQIFNSQKLEVQYETKKKEQQLQAQQQQKKWYAAITVASLALLVFMFSSYHFRLKYSIEREKKLAHEKEESERNAAMQMKLEKEEQARMKAEQQLLEMQQEQLRKEMLANSLMMEQKNEMLKLIQTKINEGDAKNVRKLLKEETLISNDFEEVKTHIQQLHPNFFNRLNEAALRKLTPLDLKYSAYIHLQMTTRQIAQLLHVEEQSVRMFKYRLKQKFGLDKDSDLEDFLRNSD